MPALSPSGMPVRFSCRCTGAAFACAVPASSSSSASVARCATGPKVASIRWRCASCRGDASMASDSSPPSIPARRCAVVVAAGSWSRAPLSVVESFIVCSP